MQISCMTAWNTVSCTYTHRYIYCKQYTYHSQVRQENVDFHRYYTNGGLEDLKFRMDQKLYPPRCKARVQAKHTQFFESSRGLDFRLVCGRKCISSGKIIIPSSNNGMYVKANQCSYYCKMSLYIDRFIRSEL